jgi:hypothetical protein
MSSTAIRHDDFDTHVVAQLKTLWEAEQCLGRLYPQLQKKPQLRALFLRELAILRQRAEHLQAVLKGAKAASKGLKKVPTARSANDDGGIR